MKYFPYYFPWKQITMERYFIAEEFCGPKSSMNDKKDPKPFGFEP